MGSVAKILLEAIDKCDCEIKEIDTRLLVSFDLEEKKDLEKQKDNFNVCKRYLERALG